MPTRPPDRPLGAFLKELDQAGIPCILIGAMAAIIQGAPIMTVDYDFWVLLPTRAYVKILSIIQRLGGSILARTFYELSDGTQVNVIFEPDGLSSFRTEWKRTVPGQLEGFPVRILPLDRIIASKRAAGRDKDLAALPAIEQTLRCLKKIKLNRRKKLRP
jgi:hypothetical protein